MSIRPSGYTGTRRQRIDKCRLPRNAADQFALAALEKPQRYFTRLQKLLFSDPTARKDAEDDEKNRWVGSLADLLRGTDTPTGKLIQEKPSNSWEADAELRRCETV